MNDARPSISTAIDIPRGRLRNLREPPDAGELSASTQAVCVPVAIDPDVSSLDSDEEVLAAAAEQPECDVVEAVRDRVGCEVGIHQASRLG